MACQVRGPDPGRSWAPWEKWSLLLTLRYQAAMVCLCTRWHFVDGVHATPDAEALELLQCWPIFSSCAQPPCSWMVGFQKQGGSCHCFVTPFLSNRAGTALLLALLSIASVQGNIWKIQIYFACVFLMVTDSHLRQNLPIGCKPSFQFLGCSPLWLYLKQ